MWSPTFCTHSLLLKAGPAVGVLAYTLLGVTVTLSHVANTLKHLPGRSRTSSVLPTSGAEDGHVNNAGKTEFRSRRLGLCFSSGLN